MDFINSYHSDADEADVEAINSSVMTSNKEIDVIDLDSDSDDESTVKNNNAAEPCKDNILNNVKEIDIIDLEDDETPDKTSETDTTSKNVSKDYSNASEKKISYLNLDDSDNDMECEDSRNNLHTLMDSASKLSDILAGPKKPTELLESCRHNSESLSSEKDAEKTQLQNVNVENHVNIGVSNSDLIYSKAKCDSYENTSEPSGKHFRAETVIAKDCDVNNSNNVESEIVSRIYREDDRIIAEKSDVLCRIPRHVMQTHSAHSSVITSLNWCIPKFSYLFLSSSLDGYIKIWDLFYKKSVQSIQSDFGFNACKWSLDGGQIIAGGKEKKAFVFDVESGRRFAEYEIYNIVTSIEPHPYMEDVFLCGTRNAILGFDIRVNTLMPIRSYFSKCEEVLDIAFVDENEFLCSTNIVSQDSADRTIMAWHFSSGAKLSNQIYLERFTCPSLKVNPIDFSFIAQSNGNYIAAFSATRPYKRKNKRYIGHKVSGYGIECDISPDGKYVVSGDAEGSVHFYNYSNTNTVFVTPSQRKIPVNRVKWHPTFYSTVITATYDGQINIWK